MKTSWISLILVCLLACACGNVPTERAATAIPDVPTIVLIPSPTQAVAVPTPTPDRSHTEGFAIYLAADGVTSVDVAGEGRVSSLDAVPLQPAPVISQSDIVAYDPSAHTFTLTPEGLERLAGLELPVVGLPFVVTVDGYPIYAGAFWTLASSQSFDGVVIMLLPDGTPLAGTHRIELGYPGPDFFRGDDPRGDSRILDALRAAGKLK